MANASVRGVRGVDATPEEDRDLDDASVVHWVVEDGASQNYRRLGQALRMANDKLFRKGEFGSGLIHVLPNGEGPMIRKAADLAPVIVDSIDLKVLKNGSVKSDLPSTTHMNALLRSNEFLKNFPPIECVTQRPVYRQEFTLTDPGYDSLEMLYYAGKEPVIERSLDTINAFLNVMAFETEADRTNTVAAALTGLLNNHWPGEKPVVLVTATKSHAGKGTITDFIRGRLPKADILYESLDWPMLKQFQSQLAFDSGIGFVCFDNVRLDSAGGRGKCIRSAFLESFVTNPEIMLAAPGAGEPIRVKNSFVVSINTNDGKLSPDLMNRALPIHLAPKGNVQDRKSAIGNPKLEFLPQNQARIEAELRGMILAWREAGCPEDDNLRHPMSRWAKTIGGILRMHGFRDFLENYATAKVNDDPIREALAVLAAAKPGNAVRPAEWAALAVEEGLERTLISAADRGTDRGRERGIGIVLRNHLDETFVARRENKQLNVRLEGGNRRWIKGKNPHVRYRFSVVSTESVPLDE